jgi:hypothetical protein
VAVLLPLPLAHGLSGRTDLPVPDWLFSWAAAIVLVASFAALAVLWPRPRLQDPARTELPAGLGRALTSRAVDVLGGLAGVALLVLVIYSGLAGSRTAPNNFAPAFVYIAFWLGLVPLSLLLGDVFRWLNPWRAVGRAVGALARRGVSGAAAEPLAYPERLGYWPAALGLLAFAWLELVSSDGDDPRTIAVATILYSALTWFGMALYGVERWCDRGEAFSVYFGLLARMSIWERRGRALARRPPLSGLPSWPLLPGAVAVLCVMIGSVSFDGFSASSVWQDIIDGIVASLADAGLGPERALEIVYAAGLLLGVLAVYGFYRLGVAGVRSATGARESSRTLARSFAHTLVPIAFAYVGAHYVSLLFLEGQSLGYLASDPLGNGSNLLGTATWTVDYSFIGSEAFWYIQVALVVLGHVAGLVLAHDRALALFPTARAAVRSQYWLLAVMVGFTLLALWLLSGAREG